jgi:oligo-1,6-glucosidase
LQSPGDSLLNFKEVFSRWDSAFENTGWISIFLSNHDQARLVSRFDNIKDYRDVQTLNAYQHEKDISGNLDKFMNLEAFKSRDNGRTPFQWNTNKNAGFTIGIPWIKVNPNYKIINEEAENKDSNSVLNYFRKVVKLRKEHLALVYGKYTLFDKNNPDVYAFTRTGYGERILVLLNFTSHNAVTNVAADVKNAKILLSNYKVAPEVTKVSVSLRPYEAMESGLKLSKYLAFP